jgi:hypothetical protein
MPAAAHIAGSEARCMGSVRRADAKTANKTSSMLFDLSQQPAMIPVTTKQRGGSAASKKDFHAAP